MTHAIDTSTGTAAIAFVRAGADQLNFRNRGFHKTDGTPWHGLGQEILPGDDADTIRAKAGLAFDVNRAQVQYTIPKIVAGMNLGDLRNVTDRDVLFRSDTGAALGVVSKRYKVHQPSEVFALFAEITQLAGFTVEVAGALHDGKRIWALARAGAGANVIGLDEVRPYVLLATSFDGSLATIGQWTAQRVVCHNTISIALKEHSSRVVIPHRSAWNPQLIKDELGLVTAAFDQFLASAKRMAEAEVDVAQAKQVIAGILSKRLKSSGDIRESKPFKRILELFQGDAIGSDLAGGQTAWQLLNSVTEYVDHEQGGRAKDEAKARSTRLTNAWFDDGNAMKTEAESAILELLS